MLTRAPAIQLVQLQSPSPPSPRRFDRQMDLLSGYTPAAPSSSSSSSSQPASPPPQTPPLTKHVTGTFQPITFDSSTFDSLQRSHNPPPTLPTKRPRPPSQPSSASNPKRKAPTSKPSNPKTSIPSLLVPSSTLHVPDKPTAPPTPWHAPPSRARTFEQLEHYTPYIPKRCALSLSNAHPGGVSVVKFSPPYGHLLLSAGNDGYARIWNPLTVPKQTEANASQQATNKWNRALLRDYHGHTGKVRDVCFTANGDSFFTAGFDRSVKLWDVEAGRIMANFRLDGLPRCVRVAPRGEGREFLVACDNRKVVQLDSRDARGVVQQYDQHMGGVYTVSFVEDDRHFVSSAEDKVLRVWEYGIPVVIKYVSDPDMHAIPVMELHPNRKWLACQSMDNEVVVYAGRDRFKHNRKKRFRGHLVAGYACGITYSADGRFVGSADSSGRLFFWQWKSGRLFRTLQAHAGVCIDLDWHPTRPSLVASCGWDGDVKIWD